MPFLRRPLPEAGRRHIGVGDPFQIARRFLTGCVWDGIVRFLRGRWDGNGGCAKTTCLFTGRWGKVHRFGRRWLGGLCRLFLFLLQLAPRGNVVHHPAGLQIGKALQFLRNDFVKLQGVLPPQQHDFPRVVQAQKLVGIHQRPLRVASSLAVRPGGIIDRGEQRLHRDLRRGGADGHHAAFVGDVLGRHLVVAAEENLRVTVADDLLPFLVFVTVGKLRDALDDDLAVDVERAANADGFLEIHQPPDVAEFFQHDVHRHREPPVLALLPRVVGQAGEEQGEEHRAEELQGAVLCGNDAEVGAWALSGEQQINVIMPGDFVHQLVLEHPQPVAEADGDVAPNLPVGQTEDAVGRLRRMVFGKLGENFLDLLKGLGGQNLVNDAEGAFPHREQFTGSRVGAALDITKQRHQKVHFGLLPKVLPLVLVRGVFDDDFGNRLDQRLVVLHGGQAVEAVAVFHVQQVVGLHHITLTAQILAGRFKKFPFGVYTNQAFLAFGDLYDERLDKSPAFAGAGRAVDDHVAVELVFGRWRQVLGVLVRVVPMRFDFSDDRPGELVRRADVHQRLHILSLHPAGGAVGGVGQDVKTPRVALELVAGKPAVAFFRNEAEH